MILLQIPLFPFYSSAFLLTPLVLWLLKSLDKNTNVLYQDDMVIRMPRSCLIVPLVSLLVFGNFALFAYLDQETWPVVLFLFFAILPQYLLVLYINCRLEMHKYTFTYRTIFRRTYTFKKKSCHFYPGNQRRPL